MIHIKVEAFELAEQIDIFESLDKSGYIPRRRPHHFLNLARSFTLLFNNGLIGIDMKRINSSTDIYAEIKPQVPLEELLMYMWEDQHDAHKTWTNDEYYAGYTPYDVTTYFQDVFGDNMCNVSRFERCKVLADAYVIWRGLELPIKVVTGKDDICEQATYGIHCQHGGLIDTQHGRLSPDEEFLETLVNFLRLKRLDELRLLPWDSGANKFERLLYNSKYILNQLQVFVDNQEVDPLDECLNYVVASRVSVLAPTSIFIDTSEHSFFRKLQHSPTFWDTYNDRYYITNFTEEHRFLMHTFRALPDYSTVMFISNSWD